MIVDDKKSYWNMSLVRHPLFGEQGLKALMSQY